MLKFGPLSSTTQADRSLRSVGQGGFLLSVPALYRTRGCPQKHSSINKSHMTEAHCCKYRFGLRSSSTT